MAQTITIDFGDRPLVLRRPTVAELDLKTITRLCAQVAEHSERRREIEADPQPGSALAIDRVGLLMADCASEVFRRAARAIELCGISWGGEPLVEGMLPAPSDATAQAWVDGSLALISALNGEAALGESPPPSG